MSQNTGYNDSRLINSFGDFVVPSWAETILLLLVSVVLLGLSNAQIIWQTVTDTAKIDPASASQTLQPHVSGLNQYLHNEVVGKATVLVVWAVIGSLAYMIIWAIQHTYFKAREDVDESGYVRTATKESYWKTRASQYLFLACSWFVFAIAVLLFFTSLLPLASDLTKVTIRHYQEFSFYLYAAEAVALTAVSLYALTRLWRAARYAVKIT